MQPCPVFLRILVDAIVMAGAVYQRDQLVRPDDLPNPDLLLQSGLVEPVPRDFVDLPGFAAVEQVVA